MLKQLFAFATMSLAFMGLPSKLLASDLAGDKKQKGPQIKVLIADNVDAAVVEVHGPYSVFDPNKGKQIASRFFGKSQLLQATTEGIRHGEIFVGTYQIEYRPDTANTRVLVDGIQYPGNLAFYQLGSRISIVNQVDVEDYLKSILTGMANPKMAPEALSAMVIAARTSAYYQAAKAPEAHWHVRAEDVGYVGYTAIEKTALAESINNSKYMVMSHDGTADAAKPFLAPITEHSAGKTAPAHAMLRRDVGAPHKGANAYPALVDRATTEWTLDVSKKEVERLTGLKGITKVELEKDTASGKVFAVRFEAPSGARKVDFLALQKALGDGRLKSSDFTVELKGDGVAIKGYGRGHGMGLCLYTAEKMAEKEQNAQAILSEFFPDTQIQVGVR